MYLDLRTLQLAAIVVCCVLGPVSLAFAPAQRHMQPSRYWGAGLIALAGGLALGSMRGHAPDLVPKVLGAGLLALALTFAQSSARSVAGKVGRDSAGLAYLALYVLMLVVLDKLSADAWLRAALGLGALGLLACRVATGFDACRGMPEGRALHMLAVLFGLFGVALFLQAILALVPSALGPSHANSPAESAADALMLVGLIAGLLLGTILLMWVMTERINARIRELVSLDPLTAALNRAALVHQFEREAARTRRRADAQFAILLIDIDQFHRVNDAFGYPAGDRLLVQTVAILRGVNRNYDLIGRLEGDVFVLLAPGSRGEGAMQMAERALREAGLAAAARAGLEHRVSVSIGVAVFGEHGGSWDTLLRAAQAAVAYAKTLGGNRAEMAVPPDPASTAPGTAAHAAPG